jgi:hypothetical protein
MNHKATDCFKSLFEILKAFVMLCLILDGVAAVIGILYGGIPKLFTHDFLIICIAIPLAVIMGSVRCSWSVQ